MSKSQKWIQQHTLRLEKWGLSQPQNIRRVIWKADPIRVDFQLVGVLADEAHELLSKNMHKPSPLELPNEEREFLFLTTFNHAVDVCSRFSITRFMMFYNWKGWLSAPDPHFHVYFEGANMYSSSYDLFFQIVEQSFPELFSEETKWSFDRFKHKHFHGTPRRPHVTAQFRRERELQNSKEENVFGLKQSCVTHCRRGLDVFVVWNSEQLQIERILQNGLVSAMSSALHVTIEEGAFCISCAMTFPGPVFSVSGYIPFFNERVRTFGV